MQHGASTLPPDAFDAFPKAGACEIHLATDFQNMVYEHPAFPKALKDEMYAWTREHAAEERKPTDTEQQFLYKGRKKAIGPFKRSCGPSIAATRHAIAPSLEERFAFLMEQLNIGGTARRREAVREGPRRARSTAQSEIAGGRRRDHGRRAQGRRAGRLDEPREARLRECRSRSLWRGLRPGPIAPVRYAATRE